jgi:hypothetical protein
MITTLSDLLKTVAHKPDDDLVDADVKGACAHILIDGLTYEVWATSRVGRLRELHRHLAEGGTFVHRPTATSVALDFDGEIDRLYVYRITTEGSAAPRTDRPWWVCACGESNPPTLTACGHCESAR